jgi:predicted Zn-dependent protease
MSILTEEQAKAILDKVIALSKADECTASLSGSIDGNIRFALNNVSTSGIVTNTDLAVQVAFGKRVGVATINEFNDAALERVVRRAEDLAKLAPENPEFMPAVEKQTYKPTATFSQPTADITPEYRAQVAVDSIGPCRAEKLIAAGFLQDGQSFGA